MTERTYKCNFCREAERPTRKLIGLEWKGDTLIQRPCYAVENHICETCLNAIVSLSNVVRFDDEANVAEGGGR